MEEKSDIGNIEKGKDSFLLRLKDDLEPVIRHAIAMTVTIICIWFFDILLKKTLGEDAKLFGQLPIIYVGHTGDSIAFLRFFYKMLKDF